MGIVVQFPSSTGGQFTAEMRDVLVRFASRTPGIWPLLFGLDCNGAEFCRFANGLMIGWDRGRCMILTDTNSGYVDRGPFRSLDEVCLLITYLTG